MMKKIEKCCRNCAYNDWFSPTEKQASCKCEEKENRLAVKQFINKLEYVAKCDDWEDENNCEHFVPRVDEEDIEITNLSIKCPHCNKENSIYEVDQSGQSDIVECEYCGKKFGYSWRGLD